MKAYGGVDVWIHGSVSYNSVQKPLSHMPSKTVKLKTYKIIFHFRVIMNMAP
jgi:hypothetical protein